MPSIILSATSHWLIICGTREIIHIGMIHNQSCSCGEWSFQILGGRYWWRTASQAFTIVYLPAGERDGGERTVRIRVWVSVQRAGVAGGGSSGPAHAWLLPHAEPQLRAGHREGLLPGRRVRVAEVVLSSPHNHDGEDHPEQHRWVSLGPWGRSCTSAVQGTGCLCCSHMAVSNKTPPVSHTERQFPYLTLPTPPVILTCSFFHHHAKIHRDSYSYGPGEMILLIIALLRLSMSKLWAETKNTCLLESDWFLFIPRWPWCDSSRRPKISC